VLRQFILVVWAGWAAFQRHLLGLVVALVLACAAFLRSTPSGSGYAFPLLGCVATERHQNVSHV